MFSFRKLITSYIYIYYYLLFLLLGMVKNQYITALTAKAGYPAYHGRLNYMGAWIAGVSIHNDTLYQWIQACPFINIPFNRKRIGPKIIKMFKFRLSTFE